MRTRTATLLSGLAVAAVTLSGCGGIRGELQDTSAKQPTEVQYVEAEGPPAIEVAAGTADSEPFGFVADELGSDRLVSGEDLYAKGATVMLFSVPTCPVCHVEGPKLAAAAKRYPDINFVVAHSQGDAEGIRAFVIEAGLDGLPNVLNLLDEDSALWNRFEVVAQPYYIFIDSTGGLSSSTGALGDDGLDRAVELIVGKQTRG